MTHTAPAIRELLIDKYVGPTPKETGVQLRLEVNVYDSGTVTVNGRVVSWAGNKFSPGTWLSVIEIILACVTMFFQEKVQREDPP